MRLDSLKIWRRGKKEAKSSSSLPATTSTGLLPSNTATAQQTTTCIASGVSDDNKDESGESVSPHLQATSASQYSGSASQTSECPPPTNPLSVTRTSPTLSKPSNCSNGNLQERLWNQAYADLEPDEHTTIKAYESFLLERSKDLEPRHMSSPDDETAASTLRNPDRMAKMVETGLEKSERIARAKKNIEEFGRVAAPVKAVMNIAVQAAPQAAIAWSCISFTLEMLANPLTESSINRDGITYVLGMMEWYWALVGLLLDGNFPSLSLRDQVEKQIVQLYQKLLLFQIKSICRYFRNQIYVVLRDVVKWDDWAGELKGVQDAEDDLRKRLDGYKDASIIYRLDNINKTLKTQFGYISGLLEAQQKRDEDNDNRRWVAALRQTNPIDDKSRIQREKGELLRESYRWVLDDGNYTAWQKDSTRHLLWIYGDPGKGKTMLLCGIIDELEKDPSDTLSYFFCQASEATLNNATSVLRGLVYSLVYRYPQLVPYIRSVRPTIGSEQFVDLNAWETLSDILEHALRHPHLHGAVLLLDALDECVDMDDRRKLVEFVRRVSSTHHVKFVITSRGWQDIRKQIGDKTDGTFIISLEENRHFVSTAVAAYIDREVQSLAQVEPFTRMPKVLTTVKSHLLQNAHDTFLWVALVCKALKQPDIEEEDHVNDVLNLSPPGLDELYKRMLSQISSSRFYSDLCIEILEVMSVLKRAITLAELHFILDALPETKGTLDRLRRAIRYCGSMLNVQGDTIHFVHQTAVDFLTDPKLEGLKKIPERHRHVFNGCLRGLRTSIKPDIYGLKAPDIHRDDIKAPEPDPLAPLKYACVYWIDHLGDGDFPNHVKDNSDAYQFSQEKFLYWIEAMSLLHEMPQAIQAIQRLQTLVERTPSSVEQGLSRVLNDANRFLLFHRMTIEEMPLQLYASCLVFSPGQSIVKAYFEDEAPKWVTVKPGLESTWPSCLQTLEDHQDGVLCAVYSHDGQWLVSGSWDGKVKLWHAGTGTCIRTVGGHGEEYHPRDQTKSPAKVISLAFSADDKSFISGSSNGVVKIWDRMTGSCIRKHETHSSKAKAMAISSDGCTAVSALPDGNIIISKINEDVPSRSVNYYEPLWGHSNAINVDLTANGQWAVVAVSSEKTIKILDTSTEELREIPAGDRSFAVAWSADGDWVASGGDRGVQIWERQTGQLVRETEFKLPGYDDIVKYVSFSADKKLLAAGSRYDISVWNMTTGALTWTIDYSNASDINSISFSPDAKRIVSASFPRTMQVWDLSIVKEAAYHDPKYSPYDLRFSDKDHFIGQYPDSSIRMWGNTGELSTFHGLWPTAMALSQDNKRLASSGKDMITIWDVENVKIILNICCRAGHVLYDERDPQVDESRRTNDDIAKLRCTQCNGGFNPMSEACDGMAFRHNFELATSFHGLIKIWSTFDGSSMQSLDSGTNFVSDMTFSSDGRLLACIAQNIKTTQEQYEAYSTSGDGEDSTTADDPDRLPGKFIQIWDTTTEQCTSISLPDTDCFFQSLSFSADTQMIAAAGQVPNGSNPFAPGICVWDVKSGSLLRFFNSEGLEDIAASFDTRLAPRLHTEYGFIDLTRYLDETNPGLGCADSDLSEKDSKEVLDARKPERMPSFCGYGLSRDRKWIVRDGKRLLWIPPDFRIGHCNGQGLTPVVDGLSIAWLRNVRSPVRMYFIH